MHCVIRWYEVIKGLLPSTVQLLNGGPPLALGSQVGFEGGETIIRRLHTVARLRVELRQSVERLIWISVRGPVGAHGAKIVVDRAVLLRHENNVIEGPDIHGARNRFVRAQRDVA